MTPNELVAADPTVKAALIECRKVQAEHIARCEAFEIFLNPRAHIAALHDLMNRATDARAIAAIAEKLDSFSQNLNGSQLTIAAELAKDRAKILTMQTAEALRGTLPNLLDAADSIVSRLRDKAKSAELAFFAAEDADYEETNVSRRFTSIADALRHFRNGLQERQPVYLGANVFGHVLDYLSE